MFARGGVEFIERGGLRLLGVNAVQRLLAYLEDQGVVVLGLDGFRVTAEGVEPDMTQIADFSGLMDLPSEQRSGRSLCVRREPSSRGLQTTVSFLK